MSRRQDGASASSMRAVMEGLSQFEDHGRLLMCMHELNHELLRGGQNIRISSSLEAVLRVLDRCGGNAEIAVLAARALNTIIDLEPRVTASLATNSSGTLRVLCRRLMDLTDMDIAEQCINWYACPVPVFAHSRVVTSSCRFSPVHSLQSVAQDFPPRVLEAGGLTAVTSHFDFFPVPLQRKAMSLASILCSNIHTKEGITMALDAIPVLCSALVHSDSGISDQACQSVAGLVYVFAANAPSQKILSRLRARIANGGLPSTKSDAFWGLQALQVLANQGLAQRWTLILEGACTVTWLAGRVCSASPRRVLTHRVVLAWCCQVLPPHN